MGTTIIWLLIVAFNSDNTSAIPIVRLKSEAACMQAAAAVEWRSENKPGFRKLRAICVPVPASEVA